VNDAREVIVALGWALGIGIAVWMVVSAQWDKSERRETLGDGERTVDLTGRRLP